MKRRTTVGLLLGSLLLASSYCIGQQVGSDQAFSREIAMSDMDAESYWQNPEANKAKALSTTRIALAYTQAARDPKLTQVVVVDAMNTYYSRKDTDGAAAATVKLQLLQVAQNQRIIQLLEQRK